MGLAQAVALDRLAQAAGGEISPPVAGSAIISPCGIYRPRLDRYVLPFGKVFAYFGVNGSTATGEENDQTVRKWIGFTARNGGRRLIAGNPFSFRATDVRELALAIDPVGPDNARHLAEIIAEADVLVPCWGNRIKVPKHLRWHLDALRDQIFAAGKPVLTFGFTKSGDPKHPLTLPYSLELQPWIAPGARGGAA